jgi:cysteine desulfurase family protein (TIGR01976 family)
MTGPDRPLDTAAIRARFPALTRHDGGVPAAYLDGPAGTQTPAEVIAAMRSVMERGVSNLGGAFAPSREAAAITDAARHAMADFLGGSPDGVVFGQNMTSLTFAVSRSIATDWASGDEIVVTSLDHDANVTPWRRVAEKRGVAVHTVPFHVEDGALDVEALEQAITDRTRLVAVTCASNALGTVTPIREIVRLAHRAGAVVYADAVHYSAHRLLDVTELGVDFVVASAYKFFGPHTGVLYGRTEHLQRLPAYKVVPAPENGPGKWETGTQSFEALAGVTAAVDYLASLGLGSTRRERLRTAFETIRNHEEALSGRFLAGLAEMPGIRLYGPANPARLGDRVSTFALAVDRLTPAEVADYLGRRGIYVWDGHYYAVAAMQHLGVLDSGGLVRVGFVHYSTADEVDRVLTCLEAVSSGG